MALAIIVIFIMGTKPGQSLSWRLLGLLLSSRLPSAFSWANALRASSQVVKCPARTIKMGTRDPSNLKLLVKVLFQHHAPLHFSTLDSQVKLVSFLLHLLLLTTNCTPNTCHAQYSITFPLKINFQYFFPPILGLITFVYLI